jgi:pimeloyl-ACP methyl ester carboxylesterase
MGRSTDRHCGFPREPFSAPRAWLEPAYSIVRWTDMPGGDHFAALEQPEFLIADIRAFFAHLLL